MARWERIRGICMTVGAQEEPTYGVRLTAGDIVWEWADVDVDPAVVDELLSRLRENQPEICHLEDIVRDFIEETASKPRCGG